MAKKKVHRPPNVDRNSQTMIPEVEDLKDQELEDAAHGLLIAKNKKKAATQAFASAYESVKELMIEKDTDFYRCHDCSFNLELTQRDEEVKLKERKVE